VSGPAWLDYNKLAVGPKSSSLWKRSVRDAFSRAVAHVSVTNVIDILLVAIVIYQFLMLVRGTRAAPMLVAWRSCAWILHRARGELTTLSWLSAL